MNQLHNHLKKIPFSKKVYLSSYFALNLINKEATGDWHSTTFWSEKSIPNHSHILGLDGYSACDTSKYFSDDGIFLGNSTLEKMGFERFCEGFDLYVADHFRAVADLIVLYALRGGVFSYFEFDDMMPAESDKQRVFEILNKGIPKMESDLKHIIVAWLEKEKIFKYY